MKNIDIYQIDAFTREAFRGNPAAVCPLDDWLPESLLQNIAMENNLSETAFFVKDPDGFHIRWFSPTEEIDLCGHATLASAFVVTEILSPGQDRVSFHSKGRKLEVHKKGGEWTMMFPKFLPTPMALEDLPEEVLVMAPNAAATGNGTLVLMLDDEDAVRRVTPDLKFLESNEIYLLVTAKGKEPYDFVSRFFLPSAGIDEDPVTGSAHCLLGPLWADILGKDELLAFQASRRGGEIRLRIVADHVFLSGTAIEFMRGNIRLH
ncbi:MAG: PhzF family phenazine biosynthesis protein [Pseudobacteriovorax sp.]|nr:PhzF family phenazine biosynthesis protein [Pseudobacteriovorax sp.]